MIFLNHLLLSSGSFLSHQQRKCIAHVKSSAFGSSAVYHQLSVFGIYKFSVVRNGIDIFF